MSKTHQNDTRGRGILRPSAAIVFILVAGVIGVFFLLNKRGETQMAAEEAVQAIVPVDRNAQKSMEEKGETKVLGSGVSHDLVCMVNDQFMGIKQIPVIADDKTYYGCCQGCVDKIVRNLQNVRYAKDPLTGEAVDKATAFIVLQPDGNNKVWYFKSEASYEKFKTEYL